MSFSPHSTKSQSRQSFSFIGASVMMQGRSSMSSNGGAGGVQANSNDFMAPENRAIRVLLTSRPATGGSPTMMEPFLSEHRLLANVRSERGEEVRLRHLEVEAEEQRKREWEAGRRARAAEEEAARQQEAQAAREREVRVKGWSGICLLMGHTFIHLVNGIIDDRKARPIRVQRKAAALLIASWYKSILIRRRQRDLVLLIKRLKRVIRPAVPFIRERCRVTCSMRVVGFLQAVDGAQQLQATVAVSRFMQSVHRLQEWWKTMLLVRETQYKLLTNHLIAFEKNLIRYNKGEKKNQSASPPSYRPLNGVLILNATALATGRSLFTTAAAFASGGLSSNHHIEIEDPALERILSKHTELLPRDLRHRLVTGVLADERRAFARRMEKYRVDMHTYAAQLHVEELRMRLMREAGLDATPTLRKPIKPVMLALLPKGRLKQLLGEGVQEVLKYKRDVEHVEILAAAERALGRAGLGHGGERSPSPKGRPQSPSVRYLLADTSGRGSPDGDSHE